MQHFIDIASDFETNTLGSIFDKVQWIRQEGHPEWKCFNALIKSNGNTGMEDNPGSAHPNGFPPILT